MNQRVFRVASVSYLNAKPLIWGLDADPAIRLDLAVPSKLIDFLRTGQSEVALLPTIDYQRLDDLQVVPSGGIGCNGPTLTVRIFAKQPIEKIRTLACDTDSHTSVALARIILADRHGVHPEFIELNRATGDPEEAKLLIGDKVVCDEPPGYPHQYDLGAEWKAMTGLPFVFAIWTARAGADLGDLPQRLLRARVAGLENVNQIIDRNAAERGWPALLAHQYLTEYLKFDIGEAQLQAIQQFHQLASKHGILNTCRPLRVYECAPR